MSEYQYATIYKPVYELTSFSNQFESALWDLYVAGEDKEKIEEVYRRINFVLPNDDIFDINVRFLERNGQLYQTNDGVLGTKELPRLSLAYKFFFHDFWLSILYPSEMEMDENDNIHAELMGIKIKDRFITMEKWNKNNPLFPNSNIFKHYYDGSYVYPSIQKLVDTDDLVQISVGQIYHIDGESYRDRARKSITEQRQEIAKDFIIPHWRKAD